MSTSLQIQSKKYDFLLYSNIKISRIRQHQLNDVYLATKDSNFTSILEDFYFQISGREMETSVKQITVGEDDTGDKKVKIHYCHYVI